MAEYVVTTGKDTEDPRDGQLSLREAVAMAGASSGRDQIVFAKNVERAVLGTGLVIADPEPLGIDGDTDGDGHADVTLSAAGPLATPLIEIEAGSTLSLETLRIADIAVVASDGRAGSPGPNGTWTALGPGGAGGVGRNGVDGQDAATILNRGDLALTRVSFEDIEVTAGDGGNGGRGGIGGTPAQAGDGLPGSNGGAGGRGGDGAEGGAAAGAVLNRGSLNLRDVGAAGPILAVAGDGGNGGPGGIGGDGGRGGTGVDNPAPSGQGGAGGRGGNGGRSGDGGDGGKAGSAAGGFFSTGTVTALTPLAAGGLIEGSRGAPGNGGASNYAIEAGGADRSNGDDGPGGAGGQGGAYGEDGSDGTGGTSGGFGKAGARGDASARDVSFWLSENGPRPESFETLIYAHSVRTEAREGGSLKMSIVRLGSSDADLTVGWAIAGRGLSRKDVETGALTGTVKFSADGPDVREVRIGLTRDDRTEGDEGFRFRLTDINDGDAPDGASGLGTSTLEGRIVDRDLPTARDDRLTGTGLADEIDGGRGDDVIRGLSGKDQLKGGFGSDRLVGGKGADTLLGGRGADTISGNAGADILDGGRGTDRLRGGDGEDTFVFGSAKHSGRGRKRDEILDFKRKTDKIDLSMIDAQVGRQEDQAFDFIRGKKLGGEAGQLNYRDGILSGDIDGDRRADFEIELRGEPRVLESDLIL